MSIIHCPNCFHIAFLLCERQYSLHCQATTSLRGSNDLPFYSSLGPIEIEAVSLSAKCLFALSLVRIKATIITGTSNIGAIRVSRRPVSYAIACGLERTLFPLRGHIAPPQLYGLYVSFNDYIKRLIFAP